MGRYSLSEREICTAESIPGGDKEAETGIFQIEPKNRKTALQTDASIAVKRHKGLVGSGHNWNLPAVGSTVALTEIGCLGALLLIALSIWIWVEITSGREEYQDRLRRGEILDEENIAYPVWKELLETEVVPDAEMKGFLNPEALKNLEYPVQPVSVETLQKSLSQYYFEADFRQSLKLGKLYTGKEVFWILPAFQILTLLFFPLGVAVFEILTTVAVYGLLYYSAVYYPGMIHMARTPHFLPTGMTVETARDRICAALQREASVGMAENGQILVDGKYPLNVEAGTFHIDFPENIGPNHRNLHLKK